MINTNILEIDSLTGLYTRWYGRLALKEIIEKGENRVFGVIDLNKFSSINEKYGVIMGDNLLKVIAQTLCDTYPDAILIHINADEFGFILNPTEYSRNAMSLMTYNLFNHLACIRVEGLEDVRLTFSIGTVFIDPTHHTNPDIIYREVTYNRKQAKKHEGNYLYSLYGSIPDIEGAFQILREDRQLYNKINNSLYNLQNEEDWLSYLHKGATLKEDMFHRNQGQLDDIFNYYKNSGLPEIDYDRLFHLVVNYAGSLDAFMSCRILEEILIPYYENQDKSRRKIRSYLGHLYLLLSDSLISVVRMGDRSKGARIADLHHKTLELCHDFPHNSIEFEPYYYTLCQILGHYESCKGYFGSIELLDNYYSELRELTLGKDPFVIPNKDVYKYFEPVVGNAKLFPIYRCCLLLLKNKKRTVAEETELQNRLAYLNSHSVDDCFDMVANDSEYASLSVFIMRMMKPGVSFKDVVDRLIIALKKVKELEYGTLPESNLIVIAYFFLASAAAIQNAEISHEEKLNTSRLGLNFLIELLSKRESIAADQQMLFLTQVIINAMMDSQILTPVDKAYYLEQTMASVSLDTYSHSKAVSAYASVILENIIDNHPEFLVGEDNLYNSVDEVLANKNSLLKFMHHACMLHDVGKIKLTSITSNAYRRLTDQEFSLIRKHPSIGKKILSRERAFEPYFSFAYNHHLWWNREAGYPSYEHDEYSAKYKVLVDILTICDSIEAATSRIGRNYRNAKTFLQIVDELYMESGSRYSSKILQSIIGSKETYDKIRQMVDIKWQTLYRNIFQELVNKDQYRYNIEPDAQMPDIYAVKVDQEVDYSPMSLQHKLKLPVWLKNMEDYDRLLYSASLYELSRNLVKNNKNIIFHYNVDQDQIGFIHSDDFGNVIYTMEQHFSEHHMNVLLSADGYKKAMSLIRSVISDPEVPREGSAKIEFLDKTRCLLLNYSSVIDKQGNIKAIVGHLEDINLSTDKLLNTIHRQDTYTKRLENLLCLFEIVIYADLDNNEFKLLKASPDVMNGSSSLSSLKDFIQFTHDNLVDPEYYQAFDDFVDLSTISERTKGQPYMTLEYHSKLSGWLLARIIPIKYDKNGKLTQVIFAAESAEQEHQLKDYLEQIANYDGLTGLLNRMKGEEIIRKEIAKGGTQVFAVIDCDNFKRINDHLSHLVGDEVLRQQTRVMKEIFMDAHIMRLGGDEFVVYFNGKSAHRLVYTFNGLKNLFNEFVEKINMIRIKELENIAPTMSSGIVFCNENVLPTFESLYERADKALQESKKLRGGKVTIEEMSCTNFIV